MNGSRYAPAPVAALVLALTGALLAGCASPPSSFYVLTPMAEAVGRTEGLRGGRLALGLGPVVFPQFLDRSQIVARDGTNRLSLDEFHRWGGSLQDDFVRVWGENLAALLETSRVVVFPTEVRTPLDFRILATVLGFEGIAGGDAILKVRWTVVDGQRGQILAVREDRYASPLRQEGGQEALVAAMSACLGAFSRDVADVVRELPKPVPPPASEPL
jgi:uncharacterized lipoprotein YmbA